VSSVAPWLWYVRRSLAVLVSWKELTMWFARSTC